MSKDFGKRGHMLNKEMTLALVSISKITETYLEFADGANDQNRLRLAEAGIRDATRIANKALGRKES